MSEKGVPFDTPPFGFSKFPDIMGNMEILEMFGKTHTGKPERLFTESLLLLLMTAQQTGLWPPAQHCQQSPRLIIVLL